MDYFNIIIYITISVVLFLIAKFFWFLFKLLIFRILIDNFVDFIVSEEDGDYSDYKPKNSSNKQDHLAKNKVKELELVSVEHIKRMQEESEDISVDVAQKSTPRIVGIKIPVYGKFTQMFANKIGIDLQNISQETLVNKGYHQAMLEMQRGQSMDQQKGKNL